MAPHRPNAILSLLVAIVCTSGAEAAPGEIHNLGVLDQATTSVGLAINDIGQVTGFSYIPADDANRAFRFDGKAGAGGVMRDLGTFGGSGSDGHGINANGQVTGSAALPSGAFRAYRYDGTPGAGSVMHNLGTLGGFDSQGEAINAAGQVAGHSNSQGLGQRHAFRYDGTPGVDGVMRDLGTLGGTESRGLGINDLDHVVGWSQLAGDQAAHAIRYDGTPGAGGVMHDLGTLGGSVSGATAINNSGQVVGNSRTMFDARLRAFRYDGTPGTGGVMRPLATLTTTNGFDFAYAINDAAYVVGQAETPTAGGSAVLWRPDLSAVDLDVWLDSVNPTAGAFWTLVRATGISESGLVTGFGKYDDGPGGLSDGDRAYILDVSPLVPEPSSSMIVLMCATTIALRRHRVQATETSCHPQQTIPTPRTWT